MKLVLGTKSIKTINDNFIYKIDIKVRQNRFKNNFIFLDFINIFSIILNVFKIQIDVQTDKINRSNNCYLS